MRAFFTVWVAQVVSLLGSQLAGFALGVWLYQRTGSVTLYGLSALAILAPQIVLGPLAGIVADRWNKRYVLMAAHAGAGVCALFLAAMLRVDALGIATILPALALSSCFNAVHVPAFSAAITVLVPAERRGRANGLVQLGLALGQLVAPAAAGALLSSTGLFGVLVVDVASFLFAIVVLAFVRIPSAEVSEEGRAARRRPALEQATFGYRYIRRTPGLFGLLLFFAAVNFNMGMVEVLVGPLVLGFSDAQTLGLVATVGGFGVLGGAAFMALTGGPRRRIHGVLGGVLLQGLLLFLGALKPSALVVAAGAFGVMFAMPIVASSSQTLWQKRVPADVQGSVFGFRGMVGGAAIPAAFLIAGPLSDGVFEPWMAVGGALSSSVGKVLGVGPGRGVALMLVVLGGLTVASVVVGYLSRSLRNVEDDAPAPEGAAAVGS